MADAGAVRRDLLPQRRHLFRQADAEAPLRTLRRHPPPRRLALYRPLGDALPDLGPLRPGRAHDLSAGRVIAARIEPPGFDASFGVRRYFDPTFRAAAVKILPGEWYVTADPGEMLVTVLGSCVTACIHD